MPLSCGLDELHLSIVSREPSAVDDASEQQWAKLCAHNPRLFDGPILSFVRLESDTAGHTIQARVESYQRLVTHQIGVCHVSVTGVLECAGSVLMGLRSPESGVHPCVWEFVPSGGLDVPPTDVTTGSIFLEQLSAELREEVGAAWVIRQPVVLGLVVDPSVPSADVVLRAKVQLEAAEPSKMSPASWEHTELQWVGLKELTGFLSEQPCIPTVHAIARAVLANHEAPQ